MDGYIKDKKSFLRKARKNRLTLCMIPVMVFLLPSLLIIARLINTTVPGNRPENWNTKTIEYSHIERERSKYTDKYFIVDSSGSYYRLDECFVNDAENDFQAGNVCTIVYSRGLVNILIEELRTGDKIIVPLEYSIESRSKLIANYIWTLVSFVAIQIVGIIIIDYKFNKHEKLEIKKLKQDIQKRQDKISSKNRNI